MEMIANSLYRTWIGLNNGFIGADPDNPKSGFVLMAKRDYSMFKSDIVLRCDTLELPDEVWPLFRKEDRIKILTRNYLDPILWQEGLNRLRDRKYQIARTTPVGWFFPKAFLFQFHHSKTKAKIPTGGGCLIGFVLIWFNDEWHLHIFSRMTEVTINLLADMYFIQSLIKKLINEGDLRKVDFPHLDTVWNIALANQKRDRVPMFLLFTDGDDQVKRFMRSESSTRWHRIIKEYFWDTFIYPEKVNWAQRKRWTDKFLENTKVDWRKLKNESK